MGAAAGVRDSKAARTGTRAQGRSSNFELMRIVLMLLIVAHHLLSNSSLAEQIDLANLTPNTRALLVFSMWGKTAINPFVMVTGYFMCTSRLTVRRFAKLYAQIKFYRLGIFAILAVLGFQVVNRAEVFNAVFNIARFAGNGFWCSFVVFYLFIPFYNALIGALDRRQHGLLVAGLITVYTLLPLLFSNATLFNEITWYMVLYFLAAYIRRYPSRYTESAPLSTVALVACVAASVASVLFFAWRGGRLGLPWYYAYRLVSDSNAPLALATGVAIFLFVKNHHVPQSKLINTVASTAFGVLLIHASSGSMSHVVWTEILHVERLLALPTAPMLLAASAMVAGLFVVCSAIDYLRIRFIEPPFLAWVDRLVAGRTEREAA